MENTITTIPVFCDKCGKDISGKPYMLLNGMNICGICQIKLGVYTHMKNNLKTEQLCTLQFDKHTLVAAWKALFGNDWKKNWRDEDRIREMKSIIDGKTIPCRPLQSWINCIEVLRYCL